jgi:hypothetical protein
MSEEFVALFLVLAAWIGASAVIVGLFWWREERRLACTPVWCRDPRRHRHPGHVWIEPSGPISERKRPEPPRG